MSCPQVSVCRSLALLDGWPQGCRVPRRVHQPLGFRWAAPRGSHLQDVSTESLIFPPSIRYSGWQDVWSDESRRCWGNCPFWHDEEKAGYFFSLSSTSCHRVINLIRSSHQLFLQVKEEVSRVLHECSFRLPVQKGHTPRVINAQLEMPQLSTKAFSSGCSWAMKCLKIRHISVCYRRWLFMDLTNKKENIVTNSKKVILVCLMNEKAATTIISPLSKHIATAVDLPPSPPAFTQSNII